MKRAELLARLGFSAPEASKIRVIVDTDAKNEADDQYAIAHFLLSPTMDIRAVTAAPLAQSGVWKPGVRQKSNCRRLSRSAPSRL